MGAVSGGAHLSTGASPGRTHGTDRSVLATPARLLNSTALTGHSAGYGSTQHGDRGSPLSRVSVVAGDVNHHEVGPAWPRVGFQLAAVHVDHASPFHTPVKSGRPSGPRGAGAARSGFPSAVRGMPGQGRSSHWAAAGIVPAASMSTARSSFIHLLQSPGNSWHRAGNSLSRRPTAARLRSNGATPWPATTRHAAPDVVRVGSRPRLSRRPQPVRSDTSSSAPSGSALVRRAPGPNAKRARWSIVGTRKLGASGVPFVVRRRRSPPPPPGRAGLRRPGRRRGRRATTHSNEQTLEDAKRNTRGRKNREGRRSTASAPSVRQARR